MSTLDQVSQEFENLQEIESRIFDVQKIQLHSGIEGFDSPDSYGVYKTSGGECLGIVKGTYAPQNLKLMLASIVESMISADISLDRLRFNEFKGGRIVSFEINLDEMTYGRPQVGDIVKRSIMIETSFDGTKSVSLGSYAHRLWCENGASTPIRLATSSFKNTKGNVGRAPMIAGDIIKAVKKDEAFHQTLSAYLDRKVSDKEVETFVLRIMGKSSLDEIKSAKTILPQNIFDAINRDVLIEMSNTGKNLFSLVQGITRFSTHSVAKADREAILYGSANNKYNQMAFSQAALMMN